MLMASVVMTATLAGTPVLAGEVLDVVISEKVLKVATNSDYPPQAFLNAQNELDGSDIDVGKEIGKRRGTEVAFTTPGSKIMTAGNLAKR